MENVKVEADCWKCTREGCLHREAFRRHPREKGGLGLCPGLEEEKRARAKARRFTAIAYIDIGIENDYWTVWDEEQEVDCCDAWESRNGAEKAADRFEEKPELFEPYEGSC